MPAIVSAPFTATMACKLQTNVLHARVYDNTSVAMTDLVDRIGPVVQHYLYNACCFHADMNTELAGPGMNKQLPILA